MTIDSFDAIMYTFQFVVPGYIICEIMGAISPKRNLSEGEKLIQAMGYSIVNIAVWYWLFRIIQTHVATQQTMYWIINAFAIVCTGCITGLILGVIRAKKIFRNFFQRIGINFSHPVPTAWDYKLSDGRSYWVEITVANGKVIRGIYSSKSLSSSESEYRDIYLEKLYKKTEDGWKEMDRTAGVWINPDEIRYIKFYEMEGIDV